jgi:hypothetical protein
MLEYGLAEPFPAGAVAGGAAVAFGSEAGGMKPPAPKPDGAAGGAAPPAGMAAGAPAAAGGGAKLAIWASTAGSAPANATAASSKSSMLLPIVAWKLVVVCVRVGGERQAARAVDRGGKGGDRGAAAAAGGGEKGKREGGGRVRTTEPRATANIGVAVWRWWASWGATRWTRAG